MQLTPTQDILPVTEFKKRAKDVMDQLHRTGRPVVLTVHGRADTVLVDAKQYEQQQQDYELLKSLIQAEQEIAEGKFVSRPQLVKDMKRAAKL
jgi:prevent-host-death family protein